MYSVCVATNSVMSSFLLENFIALINSVILLSLSSGDQQNVTIETGVKSAASSPRCSYISHYAGAYHEFYANLAVLQLKLDSQSWSRILFSSAPLQLLISRTTNVIPISAWVRHYSLVAYLHITDEPVTLYSQT